MFGDGAVAFSRCSPSGTSAPSRSSRSAATCPAEARTPVRRHQHRRGAKRRRCREFEGPHRRAGGALGDRGGRHPGVDEAGDPVPPGGHVGYVGVLQDVDLPGEKLFSATSTYWLSGASVPFLLELLDLTWRRAIDPGHVFDLEPPPRGGRGGLRGHGRAPRDQGASAEDSAQRARFAPHRRRQGGSRRRRPSPRRSRVGCGLRAQ